MTRTSTTAFPIAISTVFRAKSTSKQPYFLSILPFTSVNRRRVQDSLRRLTADLKPSIDKQAWSKVEADLRHQLGTLRFDLDALAATKDKASRKEAMALQDSVMRSLEELDLATRNRNKEASLRSLTAATDQLATLIKMLG